MYQVISMSCLVRTAAARAATIGELKLLHWDHHLRSFRKGWLPQLTLTTPAVPFDSSIAADAAPIALAGALDNQRAAFLALSCFLAPVATSHTSAASITAPAAVTEPFSIGLRHSTQASSYFRPPPTYVMVPSQEFTVASPVLL